MPRRPYVCIFTHTSMNTNKTIKAALSTNKPKYIMIGGFLGAGKTTAVGKLAAWLCAQGVRVGLITNDQGRNLVDTTILWAQGFATEGIPSGAFSSRQTHANAPNRPACGLTA